MFNIKKIISKFINKNASFSHEEVVETLKKLYNLEIIDYTYKNEYMNIAVSNMDYYIRYDFVKEKFAEEVRSLSLLVMEYSKSNPDNDWITLWYYNNALLKIFKDYFDEAYFKEQIEARGVIANEN